MKKETGFMEVESDRTGELVIVIGIVEVAERDKEDNITAVAIRNLDGELFFVENDRRGRDLLDLSEVLVEIVAILGKEKNGGRAIRAKRFSILDAEFD